MSETPDLDQARANMEDAVKAYERAVASARAESPAGAENPTALASVTAPSDSGTSMSLGDGPPSSVAPSPSSEPAAPISSNGSARSALPPAGSPASSPGSPGSGRGATVAAVRAWAQGRDLGDWWQSASDADVLAAARGARGAGQDAPDPDAHTHALGRCRLCGAPDPLGAAPVTPEISGPSDATLGRLALIREWGAEHESNPDWWSSAPAADVLQAALAHVGKGCPAPV